MTGRERMHGALSATGSVETPATICYESIYVRDHWPELTECPWWYAQSPDIEHQMAWRRNAIARTGQDWAALPGLFHSREMRERLWIDETPGGTTLVDMATGAKRTILPPLIGGSDHLDPNAAVLPTDPDRIDSAVPMQASGDVDAAIGDGSADLARAFVSEFGSERFLVGSVGAPLWRVLLHWRYDDVMMKLVTDVDAVEYACRRWTEAACQTVREWAMLGADGVWVEDCLTDAISPDAFGRINVPAVRAVNDEIRAHGMKAIYYYCGDPTGKWDMLLDTRPDALSLEESKKGFSIDVEEAAERTGGRCALFGNLDAIDLLPNASESVLRAEITRQIDAGREHGNRFVMGIGSPVTPRTTVDRVRLYTDLTHEVRRS
jgi:hypothetical protein